jgi:hypothetical protein
VNRKLYLVLFAVLLVLAATGVYARQRAKTAAAAALRQSSGQAANCDTPAPPPPVPTSVEGPQAIPPPALPGFAIEPACGTGAETPAKALKAPAPKTPAKEKAK